jgi:DNA-binding NtrC family response regulator
MNRPLEVEKKLILIVDDEPDICFTLEGILEDIGYEVVTANNAAEARQALTQQKPNAILLDIWMPDLDGTSLVKEWSEQGAIPCPIIMMSGHATYDSVVESIKYGAVAFLEKPLTSSEVLHVVESNIHNYHLKQEIQTLKKAAGETMELIGSSPQHVQLMNEVDNAAETDTSVFLIGELGTGKRTLAKQIHHKSQRNQGPLIEFSSAEANAEGLSRALFGDESSDVIHYGKIELANNGTLLLGEITGLPIEIQQRLAKVLETGRLIRDNGLQDASVNIRLIATSRFQPNQSVSNNNLSEALLYHLNTMPISIQPLRDHLEDVPDLVMHYVKYFCDTEQLPFRKFTVASLNRLRQHHWPGNIRELKNLVQRLLISSDDTEVKLEVVDDAIRLSPNDTMTHFSEIPLHLPLKEAREAFEREYFLRQFKVCDGNVAKLADKVGMERTNLYRKLRSLDIDPKSI